MTLIIKLSMLCLLISLTGCQSHSTYTDDSPILMSFTQPSELRISTPGKMFTDNFSLIHEAAYEGDAKTVDKLLKEEVSPNSPARWGSTPLHFAAVAGKTSICALLLEHGAEINLENRTKDTALDLALRNDCTNVVRLLLEYGAERGHRDVKRVKD